MTTSPDVSAAAVAYLPAATITARGSSTPARVRSTSRAMPWRHAAPPWHGAPGSAASADAECFAQAQSPPESHKHAPLVDSPATPARPSWPRSFRPKVCTPPRAVTAAVWYRPHETWTNATGSGAAGSGATRANAAVWASAAQLAGVGHRGRPVAAAAGAVVASGGVEVADVGDEGGVTGGGGPDDGLVRGDALDWRGGHGPRVRGATQAIATDAPRHGARAYGRRGGEVRVRVRVRGSRIEGVAGVGGGGGRVDGVAPRDASSGRASTSWPADASGSARANRRGWSLCVGLVSPEWLRNRGRNISARAVAATHAIKNAHSQRVSRGRMVVRAGVAPRRVTAVAISFGREAKRVTTRSRIDSRARTPREDASRPSPSFAAHARAPTSSQQVSSS